MSDVVLVVVPSEAMEVDSKGKVTVLLALLASLPWNVEVPRLLRYLALVLPPS